MLQQRTNVHSISKLLTPWSSFHRCTLHDGIPVFFFVFKEGSEESYRGPREVGGIGAGAPWAPEVQDADPPGTGDLRGFSHVSIGATNCNEQQQYSNESEVATTTCDLGTYKRSWSKLPAMAQTHLTTTCIPSAENQLTIEHFSGHFVEVNSAATPLSVLRSAEAVQRLLQVWAVVRAIEDMEKGGNSRRARVKPPPAAAVQKVTGGVSQFSGINIAPRTEG